MNTHPSLRDRDAIVTRENIIFRVYGYAHPPDGYICDPEYTPESIYKSTQARALRKNPYQKRIYYKFYSDEGLRFIRQNYPRYTIYYPPLETRLVGVEQEDIEETRTPQQRFQRLVKNPPKDALIAEMQTLYGSLKARAILIESDFGVFGSLLHDFYHPRYSDLDFTVYGREQLETLQQTLQQLYEENDSKLENEFSSEDAIKGKTWHFKNYTPKEYVWHQKRKLIYALFKGRTRTIKTEFEPVKRWEEIHNEYNPKQRVAKTGWIRAKAQITDDKDAPFMPSIYEIEPLQGAKVEDVRRILSYVEEFRMQAKKDETVTVEGNLEKVTTPQESFYQITLTHGPRYYEQTLKVAMPES
jgi:predicted nucleotidyltransferase